MTASRYSRLLEDYRAGRIRAEEVRACLDAMPQSRPAGAPVVGDHVPFTPTQKSLWLRQSLYPGRSGLSVPLVIALEGNVAAKRLDAACDRLIARHPLLSCVVTEAEDGLRRAAASCRVDPLQTDAGDLADWRTAVAHLLRTKDWLPGAPLLRVFFVYPDAESTIVVLLLHHIIADATSLPALARSFLLDGLAGRAEATGVDEAFMRFAGTPMDLGAVAPLEPVTPPGLLAAGSAGSRRPEAMVMDLPRDRMLALERLARTHEVSFATLALAIYCVVLGRHVGDPVVRVGVAMDARPDVASERDVGCFFNTVAVEVEHPGHGSVARLLSRLKAEMIAGIAARALPAVALHETGEIGAIGRTGAAGALYHGGFVFHDLPSAYRDLEDRMRGTIAARILDEFALVGEHDLGLEVCVAGDHVRLALKYDAKSLTPHDAQAFLALYGQIAREVTETEDGMIAAPRVTLHGLIAAAIARHPANPAIVFGPRVLTYAELEARSTALCARLKSCGIGRGDVVAICVERAPELIVAMLAVMRSGAAYLPLDPSYPASRIAVMVEDSKACLLIGQRSPVGGRMLAGATDPTDPCTLWELVARPERAVLRPALDRVETPLYVLYTSGSSGKPKGVVVSHENIVNLLNHFADALPVTESDVWLALTTVSFDISALELFAPLIRGATCHLVASDVARDADRLRDVIEAQAPSIIQATPMTWRMLLEAGWNPVPGLRVLCGGERLPQSLCDALTGRGVALYNLYGPTETTVWSTARKLSVGERVTIGRAVARTDIHLLDAASKPVPPGQSGEICIGGAGVSLGYLGRPDLTAERFIADPAVPGRHIYRTGDLGRWDADGNLEFLGRLDDQVKINGFRIEPGECEEQICAHPDVQDCAVQCLDEGGEARLVAYVVPLDPGLSSAVMVERLTRFLAERVPRHLVPSRVSVLAALPRTLNGKVDRKALTSAEPTPLLAAAETPDLPAQVLAIWRDALAMPTLGAEEGFFDAGGTSLLAVQLSRRLGAALGRRVTATSIFEHGTARALSEHLLQGGRSQEAWPSATGPDLGQVPLAVPQDVGEDDVAIVGLSCTFGEAEDARAFWTALSARLCSVRRHDRAGDETRSHAKPQGADGDRFVPVHAPIADPDTFDAAFFRVSPRDAGYADPQLRKLLHHAWAAVEDAGRHVDEIRNAAVYVTAAQSAYLSMLDRGNRFSSADGYAAWVLNQPGTMAGMISSKLGLQGESLHIHSNCSSSLVALRAGVDCLVSGRADYALVGAASIAAPLAEGYAHEPGLNFSPTGMCRPFDAAADGLVPGDGVGVVLLRRARDAMADGDDIYCLIRGVGVNNDGGRKAGFYAPSANAQAELVAQTLKTCDVPPETVLYLEAHGTGTRLGDAVEASALRSVFAAGRTAAAPLAIGSVKANLGHLDVAAGMAGLIKVALGLRSRQFPPEMHFETASEECAFDPASIMVARDGIDCRMVPGPLRACLSSFGLGGTNAHAVLQSVAPRDRADTAVPGWMPVVLSARTPMALARGIRRLADWLERAEPGIGLWPRPGLTDLGVTLMLGRVTQDQRLCVLTQSIEALVSALREIATGAETPTALHVAPAGGSSDVPDDLLEAARRWLAEGDTGTLARWLPVGSGCRVHLPGYAFAEDRHGIDLAAPAVVEPQVGQELSATLFVTEHWHPAAAPQRSRQSGTRLIVLADKWHGTDRALRDIQRDSAVCTILAIAGEHFADRGDGGYTVDVRSADGFARGLHAVLTRHTDIDHVVYRGLAGGAADGGYTMVNRFLRACLDAKAGPFHVTLAPLGDSGLSDCHAESWIGYARSLGASASVASVSVFLTPGLRDERQFLAALDGETPGDPSARVLRWVDGIRTVPRLEEVTASARNSAPETGLPVGLFPQHEPLQTGGAYVFTGGGGALGQLLFRRLLQTGRLKGTRWLLLGRRGLSPALRTCIEQAMEHGVRVRYARADVSRRAEVERALDLAGLRPGDVRGVIHAAGVEPSGTRLEDDPDGFDRSIRAKVQGARVLVDLCAEAPLDFLCLVSSTSALIGDYGECSYAVANRFLNAFGRHVAATTTTAVSVLNWPLWADGAMGRAPHQLTAQARLGFRPLPSEEAVDLWARLLGGPIGQFALFHGDITEMRSLLVGVNGTRADTGPAQAALRPPVAPAVAQDGGMDRARLGALLRDCAAQIIGIAPSDLSLHATFTEQGFDSFTLAQFANRVSGSLDIALSPATLFSHPTPDALLRHLVRMQDVAPSLEPATAGGGGDAPVRDDTVAIVGLSGRFAGAESVADLGRLLAGGDSAITEVPPERFSMDGIYGDPLKDAFVTDGKWIGALADVKGFDAAFFNLSAREASDIDPRQRLLLQHFWHALEQAGLNRRDLKRQRVGVFVGAEPGDYQDLRRASPLTANHDSLMAARLAYHLDLDGPVMTINTSCSSGLVALHQAWTSLRSGACDVAFVGAANLILDPGLLVRLGQAGMVSATGECRPFDRRANGLVPGEAVVALVLKRTAAARLAGDVLEAVIDGCGINYDGFSMGITAPNGAAQARLIGAVHDRTGIDPRTIRHFIAHGTGTGLGDPIESQALAEVFGRAGVPRGHCAVTSVKGHVGHSFAASGLVNIAALVESMRTGVIPAAPDDLEPSPHMNWADAPVYLPKGNTAWDASPDGLRRGATSAFGMSGTNAHIVLSRKDAGPDTGPAVPLGETLFVLSARSDAALRRRVADMCAWLDGQPDDAALPARVAHVLTARRFHFEHRVAVIAGGREDLLARWRRFLDRVPDDCVLQGAVTPDQLKQRAAAEAEAGTVLRASDAPLADLARAYCASHEIALDLDRNGPIAALTLPDYPFQLKDCWIPKKDLHSAARRAESSISAVAHPASSMALSGSGKVRLTLLDQVLSGSASAGLSGSVPGARAESDTDGGATPPRPLPPFQEGEPAVPSNGPKTGRPGVDHGRVRARLRASLADMLLLEPHAVDPARSFTEQALDSILGVEWVRELNRAFGLGMKTSVLYDHPCVDALADHIAGLFDRAGDTAPPGPTAVPGAEARTAGARKLPQASSVDPVVRAAVAEVLLLDAADIDPERDFVSLGLDSIIGVDLVRMLNTRLDLSMRTSVLYDRPTLLALSGRVRELVGGQNTAADAPAQPLRMDNARRVVQEPVQPAPTQPHRTADPRPRQTTPEPIAIIGAAGRYPGIDTLDQYWEVLVQGRDMVREVPAWRGFAAASEIYCRWMGSLDDVDRFDPLFFNISPRDAERMDPQHRLFLEEAYRTVEDAGYDAGSLGNARCGVFLGIMGNEYASMQRETGRGSDAAEMLGGSHAVAAARIAFHLNLKGPALAIDTACSSSLVAVHLACQAIRNGDCDLALAGGVSTYLLPDSYVGMCDAGMLSPRGRCHAFDDGADGFVPGEGVGCVLLKSLSQALKDGDRIDGVILGSGINQDGRTNGITAPSRMSQTALLTEVYARNGIDPGTIQYAEMHGTGTPLGDPIELEALAEAFEDGTGVLRIGSVKSNLGHCSAAAGVAGLHKLLLMLRHRAFVPTIHVQTPTRRFAFDESPLSLGTDHTPWPQPGDGGARRACLSSFGYSGTNAHLVLAEWREPAAWPELVPSGLPLVLPFSARTEPQLIALAASMARHLEDHPDVSPEAVADTLRRGRKPMRERLAVVVTDLAQAAELLRAVARGLALPPGAFRGSAPVVRDTEPDARPFTSFGVPAELAAAWVTGGAVDWTPRIAGVAQPVARVRLPGHPFERRRCWLEPGRPSVRRTSVEALPGIITRTYGFDATHRLIREHVVNGLPLLPGTAMIDLVLDAAMGALSDGKGFCLTGGTWLRPIALTDASVHLVVSGTRAEGTLSLMLRSLVGDDQHPSEHFTCTLDPDHSSGAPGDIDPVALYAAWTPDPAAVEDLLSRQARAGIAYGPSYRCLGAVYRDGDDAVLVRLDAPRSGVPDDGLVLNPALLDAAMQAAGLVMAATDDTVRVPFAFRTLRLAALRNGRAGAPRWVSVRRSDRDNARGPQVTVQVTLYDAAGTWLLDIADLTLRAIAGSPVLIERLEPRWLPLDPMAGAQPPVDADHAIWLLGFTGHTEVRQALDGLRLGTGPVVESVGRAGDTSEQILADLHGRVKAFVQRQGAAPAIVQLVVIDDDRCLSAASALLRAVGAECVRLRGRTIVVPASLPVARIAEAVAIPVGEGVDHVFVDASEVRHRVWMPKDADEAGRPLTAAAPPWRADGVYLVTGGSGGIGREIAVWLASHAPKARLVLCGRRAEHELAWLADLPGRDRVSYHRIDITDRRSVEDLGRTIAALHGRLDGVIHAAGLVTDRRIGEKSAEEVLSVLAPKTLGLRLLDAMSAAFELDFFAAFSSVSAALGVVGQTDYAMANAYMDDFILWRRRAVQRGARTGQSLSINWPIWQSGGMRVEPDHLAMLERTQGVVALTTMQAMQAFAAALRGAAANVMVLASVGRTIAHPAIRRDAARPVAGHPAEAGPIAVADQPAAVDAGRIERIIIEAAAAQLGVDGREIDVDANLGDYGFDSISFTKLGAALNAQLGLDLTPPIFFEHLTVALLAGHIARLGRVRLPPVSTPAPTPVARPVPLTEAAGFAAQAVHPPFDRPAPESAAASRAPARSDPDGVAIIGVSAAFPLAQDIAAFWENLASDRLCIGDLPAHRRDDWILENGATCPTRAGFMEGIDQFDPLFFRLSPKEAALMDPHQRLLLMHAWRAVEDAGYAAADLRGTDTAVYFGTAGSGYAELLQSRGARVESHTATGNVASVAPNRVSYLFDLHGPSEPVETACSSALVAVHKACDAIRLGRSRMAIVGAVNVLATATSHLSFHKAGMLSPDAACKTFSADANGYVRGEGVGVLLLKSLKACEEDGDAIYGVIRGSAVNHGGHAASFTSPNPNAQAALVADAIRQSGLDPASISYIECHGTGTPLGDPIEVEGLLSAFAQVQDAGGIGTEAACALGSVKSNIGHLELAAGIAGIVKVLMQIRHRTLPGSLNSLPVNPYLRLEGTRFSIVHQKQPWTGRKLADGTTDALVAGVSSFGFGGTNAHVILSEHIGHGGTGTTPATQRPGPSVPLPFVLSAAEEPVLREQARALAARLKADPLDLLDVSCTLCSGRTPMRARLGLVASTLAELVEVLETCAASGDLAQLAQQGRVWLGAGTTHPAGLAGLDKDAVFSTLARQWVLEGQAARLVEMWCHGAEVPWRAVFAADKPRRVHLPTYPFQLQRYWYEESGRPACGLAGTAPETTLPRQVTVPAMLADQHRIDGRRVMPGATYLALLLRERARLGATGYSDMRWPQWLEVVDGADPVALAVRHDAAQGTLAFAPPEGDPEQAVCRARIVTDVAQGLPRMALDPMQADPDASGLDAERLYRHYAEAGLDYGETFRVLDRMWISEDRVLARLRTPVRPVDCPLETMTALLDAMFHAAGAWHVRDSGADRLFGLPTSIERITVADESLLAEWVVVERLGSRADTLRSTLSLCDASGSVILRVENVLAVSANTALPAADDADALAEGAVCSVLTPIWQASVPQRTGWSGVGTVRVVGATGALRENLVQSCPDARFAGWDETDSRFLAIPEGGSAPAPLTVVLVCDGATSRTDGAVCAILSLVKTLGARGWRDRPVTLKALTVCGKSVNGERPDPAQAAVHGFLGALARERPLWRVDILDFATEADRSAGVTRTLEIGSGLSGAVLAKRAGRWYMQRLSETASGDAQGQPTRLGFRERGIYLVLGGGGGLGVALSEWLIRQVQARILWVGRRPAAAVAAARDAIHAATGSRPDYIQADARSLSDMERVRAHILAAHGRLDGVFVATMRLHDKAVDQLEDRELLDALGAKIDVCQTALHAFAPAASDFIVHFGSTQSFSTEAGQSAYAAASQGADAVMSAHVATAGGAGVRVGTVHWGFWGHHGAVATPRHRELMRRRGVASLQPDTAFSAMHDMLTRHATDLAVIRATAPLSGVLGDAFAARTTTMALSDAVAESTARLDRNLAEAMTAILFGVLDTLPDRVAATDFAARVHPRHARWVVGTLRFASEFGLLAPVFRAGPDQGPTFKPTEALRHLLADPAWVGRWTDFAETHGQDPHIGPQVELAAACIAQLRGILRGDVLPVQVLFPDSRASLTADVYESGTVARHINHRVAQVVAQAVEPAGRTGKRLRILEVGAGSGATTRAVLGALDGSMACLAEYCFSDISPTLLEAARRMFRDGPSCLRFRRIDLEDPEGQQGPNQAGYDVVVAANVLHATADIVQVLARLKTALAPGGVLVLAEISDASPFTHATFGLLDGWWRFEDERRIPGCPGLYPAAWRRALEDAGFAGVTFPAAADHILGQQVILARADARARPAPLFRTMPAATPSAAPNLPAVPGPQSEMLSDEASDTATLVRDTIAGAIGLSARQIHLGTPLDRYGVDSLLHSEILARLRPLVRTLPDTVLFEYPSVQELADYIDGQGLRIAPTIPAPALVSDRPERADMPPVRPHAARVEAGGVATGAPVAEKPEQAVAIIGMAGRFPGCDDIDALWAALSEGRNCIGAQPADRWTGQGARGGWGGFLHAPERFDFETFGLKRDDLRGVTPELGLLLETCWHAFEDAGYGKRLLGRLAARKDGGIGVFVGSMYDQSGFVGGALGKARQASNTTGWNLANRLSHMFDLQGPSIFVNTACSGAVSAIHLACQSIRSGQCPSTLVAGVNLTLDSSKYDALDAAGFLGTGPLSRSFGTGDGFIPSEAVAAVYLKRLDLALRDGDPVRAVIRADGVAHSGGRQSYTAPDPQTEARLITRVLAQGGVDPADIGYVECSANGSPLGDAVEITAIKTALAVFGDDSPCALGTVKSNLGHMEAASGIVQLIKVVLMMERRHLVASINSEPANPLIRLDGTRFAVQKQPGPWPEPRSGTGQRHALVTAFGAGGSYGCLLVRSVAQGRQPMQATSLAEPPPNRLPILLSARSKAALRRRAVDIRAALHDRQIGLGDLSASLFRLDHDLPVRWAALPASTEDLLVMLDRLASGHENPSDYGDAADLRRWVGGEEVSLTTLFASPKGRFIRLPAYPFERPSPTDIALPPDRDATLSMSEPFDQLIAAVKAGLVSEHEFARSVGEIRNA